MNWMRLKLASMELAKARASWVLPVPGLSSSSTYPPASNAVTHCLIGVILPATAMAMFSTSALNDC